MILTLSYKSKTKREWDVPINTVICKSLTEVRRYTSIYNSNFTDEDQLFNLSLFASHFKNNEMTVDNVSSFFKRLSKKMGVVVSPHRFRHTMATQIASQDANLKALQEMLGHTNIQTTLRYVHPKMRDLRKLQTYL